jgi:hypothetical protein
MPLLGIMKRKISLIIRQTNKTSLRALPIEISWPSLVGTSTAYLRIMYRIPITIASTLSQFTGVLSTMANITVVVKTKSNISRVYQNQTNETLVAVHGFLIFRNHTWINQLHYYCGILSICCFVLHTLGIDYVHQTLSPEI